ncbi:hypothetical protein FEK35_19845 [Nocardia cyriacigeorgica]|uniref:HEAT repeat domain-containing protein n=1 Tax=Nocardia cyriacigeorgica TaxID=135487 RepID=A0A5R8PAW6_9NOCA|nr:hypothetical protein [Nocardia cyriacigeorgica]TLG04685.1 hypothetical protein FEK35_19845 [Nocardia cyriacigeorgica]
MAKDSDALRDALAHSHQGGLERIQSIAILGRLIPNEQAVQRLKELLNDEIVTVEVDAAETLARHGGTEGILAVLHELGRRKDDPDADYMGYRLYELDAGGEVAVIELAESASETHSDYVAVGLENLRRLRFGN